MVGKCGRKSTYAQHGKGLMAMHLTGRKVREGARRRISATSTLEFQQLRDEMSNEGRRQAAVGNVELVAAAGSDVVTVVCQVTCSSDIFNIMNMRSDTFFLFAFVTLTDERQSFFTREPEEVCPPTCERVAGTSRWWTGPWRCF